MWLDMGKSRLRSSSLICITGIGGRDSDASHNRNLWHKTSIIMKFSQFPYHFSIMSFMFKLQNEDIPFTTPFPPSLKRRR